MSKDSGDNLDWAIQLGCPPSVLTNDVKKILNQGIMSFVWDEIASVVHPVEDVVDTRKNILLNHLQSQAQVPAIQHINKIKLLKNERALVNSQIDKVENMCETLYHSLEEKELKISKLKNQQEKTEIKTGALELKLKNIESEINSCKEFISYCNNLLPANKHEIDEAAFQYCLTLAGSVISRQGKLEALKQIQEILDPLAIPELWDSLLRKRMQDTEKLTRLQLEQENNETPGRSFDEAWKIGLASVEAQIITSTLEAMIHKEKLQNHLQNVVNIIDKIMVSDSEQELEWIQLNLEIAQQDKKYKELQSCIEYFKNFNEERHDLTERQSELSSELHNVNSEMKECIETIKNSLRSVISAGNFLEKIKDNLIDELMIIALMNRQFNANWLDINLTSEIDEFHKNTDVNALNKVMLLDKVGAYRYASICMSNILPVTPTLTLATPVFSPPLCHLIYCLRNLMANSLLKQQHQLKNSEYANQQMIVIKNSTLDSSKENDIFELLDKISYKNGTCRRELDKLETIYDAWANQPVQEAMSVIDDTAHRLTYDEWVKRYSSLLFMITRNK